jgi:tetrahydromethanopterin S-methyltransferase subunit F
MTNWEDLEDMVKSNQIQEMSKSEFLKLESNLDSTRLIILNIGFCSSIILR